MILKISRWWLFSLLTLTFAAAALAQSSLCAPVSNNPRLMANLCSSVPDAEPNPGSAKMLPAKSPELLLTLTVQQINTLVLDDPPTIRFGDTLLFEANRGDFILES